MKFLAVLMIFVAQLSLANELVIFLGEKDVGSKDLKDNFLTKITEDANSKKVSVIVKELKGKVPEGIKFVPSIYFQNYKGRSLYLGRYNNTGKISKFIQTRKFIADNAKPSKLANALVFQKGDFRAFVRLKITDLTGAKPAQFDKELFAKKSEQAVRDAFLRILSKSEELQESGDRTFYFDIYPWRGEDDTLALNLAIYSQFDCHKPIFTYSTPVLGKFNKLELAFAEVAKDAERKLFELLETTKLGDALHFDLGENKVAWEDLGLNLPAKPTHNIDIDPGTLKLSQTWKYIKKSGDKKAAAVFFNFPAPLNHYQGQITESESSLELGKNLSFKDVKGLGSVVVDSLDMGDSMLNSSAISSIGSNDNKATLKFEKLNFLDGSTELKFGEISPILGEGIMTLKGREAKISLKGDAGLILDDSMKPRLFLNMKYQVNIRDHFEVTGPDSSTESNNLMDYNIVMEMEPVTGL